MSDKINGNKGQPKSTEHRKKMSIASKGKPKSEEHKEALRKAWVKRRLRDMG